MNKPNFATYPYDWAVEYLKDARGQGAIDADTTDAVIEREAYKLETLIFQLGSSFVDNEFDETPGYVLEVERLLKAVQAGGPTFELGQTVQFKQANMLAGQDFTITDIGRDSDNDVWVKLNNGEPAFFDWYEILIPSKEADVYEEADMYGTLNPAYTDGKPRFVLYVKDHEPDEEPGWQFKIEVYDHKYLDSDSLPITAIAGGDSYPQAFKRASEMVEEALSTDHCVF